MFAQEKEKFQKKVAVGGKIVYNKTILQVKEVKRMEKIQMTTPLVEMDGDEMTRILWQAIK